MLDGWLDARLITGRWGLTDAGRGRFTELGVDTSVDPRRELLRPCIDWTERRPHAAGALADRLAAAAFDRGWVIRGSHLRSARLTPTGVHHLRMEQRTTDTYEG
jgi:hypothetical protein